MSAIDDIGDRLIAAQTAIGLKNSTNFNRGLSESDLVRSRLLQDLPKDSELHQLIKWRDGVVSDARVPMGDLWIKPGFFILSLQDIQAEHDYFSQKVEKWKTSWYPLLSDGSSDRIFFDLGKVRDRRIPLFYSFPESGERHGQIYDSIESMLLTLLNCYQSGAYFLDSQDWLETDMSREAEIARSLNPLSDYWLRLDLF